jgi:putative ABC transport system ATP-binding protein
MSTIAAPTNARSAGIGSMAVETHAVSKTLPHGSERITILDGISLRVAHGEFVALVGPSGSGKSTLLGILAGLDSPTSGTILVDGLDITHLAEARLAAMRNRKIGMVFQLFNLIPTLTAQENVEVPLYVGRQRGNPARRAREMLDLVGMSHRFANKPNQLSGGEQQRVAIARAFVTDPALIIMDEPTGNLDLANGAKLLALIAELRRTTGTTFIIATHDPNVATVAERAIRLIDGHIAE